MRSRGGMGSCQPARRPISRGIVCEISLFWVGCMIRKKFPGRGEIGGSSGPGANCDTGEEAAIAQSQHGKVARVVIHQGVDFASRMIDGRTVSELAPNSRSAQEAVQ